MDEVRVGNYRFGEVEVDGRPFRRDLKIVRGRVREGWWRDRGHAVGEADLVDVIEARPAVLVLGTGASGLMRPDPSLEEALAAREIRLEALPSARAVERFNELCREMGAERVALAIHLTC
ncbi:hypothetical protein HCU62_02320 [Dissulfurirhabdus thermomarina]|uniref:MTH938/NDUFAF3 family protein n=1 Tax=Dissulfurirhabdus thermomarina TaxID=1765737 RepID=UPI0014700B7F|nr:MTH938/NDUFAF3 family protein [Dissulfurirhabdus thermomarina]NMX22780.1 hypothetical protein [Dissulfurirhabdus thermomarina]